MRTTTLATLVVMAITGATCLFGQQAPAPEKGMVIGEVIDVTSFAMKGERGEEHASGGQYRASAGFPIGILEEETGRVYIAVYRLPVPAAGLQTANSILTPLMGKRVVVQGLKYHAPGVNVVRISLVSEIDGGDFQTDAAATKSGDR